MFHILIVVLESRIKSLCLSLRLNRLGLHKFVDSLPEAVSDLILMNRLLKSELFVPVEQLESLVLEVPLVLVPAVGISLYSDGELTVALGKLLHLLGSVKQSLVLLCQVLGQLSEVNEVVVGVGRFNPSLVALAHRVQDVSVQFHQHLDLFELAV